MTKEQLVQRSIDILGGEPVFAGTRVPIQALIDYLKRGHTVPEFLDDFPTVKKVPAAAALDIAAEALTS